MDLSTSLDLSAAPTPSVATLPSPPTGPPPPPPASASGVGAAGAPAGYEPPRARPGPATVLGPHLPTVTLTRIQSGVGALGIELAISDSVGDLRLGCAYQLSSGQSSILQQADGRRAAPADSRRPALILGRGRFETLTIDLVQNRALERMVVYAYSESGGAPGWGGTLVVTTYGGARIEVPLARDSAPGVLVALSTYNIDGELVLRAEQTLVAGTVRDATMAFGFDRISWLDDTTPLS